MIRHVKNKHSKEYNKFFQAIQAKAPQQTLRDTFKRKEKCPRDSDMAKSITENVTEFIALDNRAFSVVEDHGFHRLLDCLNRWYALLS